MKNKNLPPKFKKYFWDCDPAVLDFDQNAVYIISRLFEYGDFPALRWVVKRYPVRRITQILKRSRVISPRTRNFWVYYFSRR